MHPAISNLDRAMASISGRMTFILRSTPANLREVFTDLSEERAPRPYRYRSCVDDIADLQRDLDAVNIESVEEPSLHALLARAHLELSLKVEMLRNLGTSRYLSGSLRVFGDIEDSLLQDARQLVETIPYSERVSQGPMLDAAAIQRRGQEEIDFYAGQMPSFSAQAQIKDGVAAGMVCSRGHLLVDTECEVTPQRIQALLHHEVGTHLVTYYNGRLQPLTLLAHGMPGYLAMQEGLAVLAEYLAGGIDARRLRILACRVIAVRAMLDGADLSEVFKELMTECGLTPWIAYRLTSRVFRGGGLTKDAVYLRGLRSIMELLRRGVELEPLYLGKISFEDLALVQRLLKRGVLTPPTVLPRFLSDAGSRERVAKLRTGLTLRELVKEAPCV